MPHKKRSKKIINGLAIMSLFIAFYIGQSSNKQINQLSHSNLFETYHITRICEKDDVLKAYSNDDLVGYISTGTSQGYGGPLEVAVLADSTGAVIDVDLIHNTETHAYITKLKNKRYFDQYERKRTNDKYLIHEDIDAVSGATVSSNAIALASRKAAWQIACRVFALSLPDVGISWHIGLMELLAIGIFIIAFLAAYLKKKTLRYVALFSSFVVLGFMLNASISLSHIGRVLLGYIPDIRQHFVWWLLMFGNLLVIVIWGRNIYCHAACPFHAGQILLHKISGMNLKMPPKLSKYLIKTPKFLLWLSLILILISRNPTLASYEPFAIFFSLEGVGIQWYILPVALIGSIFISDFFCHYFCPVGASFKLLLGYRKDISKRINSNNGKA
ncbi:FMN-binding protein [Marinilabiliaceae bacterium JC017]|nr:FMN-binding protein [Marinilabiliaceae bacterium JC017]